MVSQSRDNIVFADDSYRTFNKFINNAIQLILSSSLYIYCYLFYANMCDNQSTFFSYIITIVAFQCKRI